jgi:hypothetical protein
MNASITVEAPEVAAAAKSVQHRLFATLLAIKESARAKADWVLSQPRPVRDTAAAAAHSDQVQYVSTLVGRFTGWVKALAERFAAWAPDFVADTAGGLKYGLQVTFGKLAWLVSWTSKAAMKDSVLALATTTLGRSAIKNVALMVGATAIWAGGLVVSGTTAVLERLGRPGKWTARKLNSTYNLLLSGVIIYSAAVIGLCKYFASTRLGQFLTATDRMPMRCARAFYTGRVIGRIARVCFPGHAILASVIMWLAVSKDFRTMVCVPFVMVYEFVRADAKAEVLTEVAPEAAPKAQPKMDADAVAKATKQAADLTAELGKRAEAGQYVDNRKQDSKGRLLNDKGVAIETLKQAQARRKHEAAARRIGSQA